MKESKEAARRRKSLRPLHRSVGRDDKTMLTQKLLIIPPPFKNEKILGGKVDFERPSGGRSLIRIFRDNLLIWIIKMYFSCILPGPKYPLRLTVI